MAMCWYSTRNENLEKKLQSDIYFPKDKFSWSVFLPFGLDSRLAIRSSIHETRYWVLALRLVLYTVRGQCVLSIPQCVV